MAASQPAEISATEIELKRRGRRRLIGAITLGLIAVVFLPMIFDSEPRRNSSALKPQEISVQLPSKEGQPVLAAPVAPPTAVQAPAQASAPAATVPSLVEPAKMVVAEPAKESAKEPAKEFAKDAVKAVPPAKAEKTGPKIAEKAVEKADAKAVADKKGFVVQLGVFSDADNAKQAVGRMKEAKLPVYTESLPIKSGNATRVRVGPYATKEKADAALAKVKLAGADGKIVPLK